MAVQVMAFLSLLVHLSVEQKHDIETLTGDVVHDIVKKHFSSFKCIGVITDRHSIIPQFLPKDIDVVQIEMSSKVMEINSQFWEDLDSVTKDFEILLRTTMDFHCFGYIVQVWNYKSVIYSLARSQQRGSLRVLFVPVIHFLENVKTIVEQQPTEEVFRLKQLSNIPDIVVIKLSPPSCAGHFRSLYTEECGLEDRFENVKNRSESVMEFVTHKFVGKTGTEEILLDTWSSNLNDRLWLDKLYKNKLFDLEGKELKMAVLNYTHSVIMREGRKPEGRDMRIMEQFIKRNNFTMTLLDYREFIVGDIHENGTGAGILGKVADERANMAFVGLLAEWPWILNWTSYSEVYTKASITGLMPVPKLLPRWRTVFRPFSSKIWMATGNVFLVSSVATYGIAKISDKFFGKYSFSSSSASYHHH